MILNRRIESEKRTDDAGIVVIDVCVACQTHLKPDEMVGSLCPQCERWQGITGAYWDIKGAPK
jgi:hypothetical protein